MELKPFLSWSRESSCDRLRIKRYYFRRVNVQLNECVDGIVKLTFRKQRNGMQRFNLCSTSILKK